MEKSVYKIIAELHTYMTTPERKVFTTNDITHMEAVLGTLLAVYKEDPAEVPLREPQEARRPGHASNKPKWYQFWL